MKTIDNYFDEAKKITGSDYATAKKLGMTPNRISHARRKGSMSNDFCRELAELIGCSPLEIIAAAEIKKHPGARDGWARWVAAAVILTSTGIGYSPSQSKAYGDSSINPSIHYAQLKKRLKRAIRRTRSVGVRPNGDQCRTFVRWAIDRRSPRPA